MIIHNWRQRNKRDGPMKLI